MAIFDLPTAVLSRELQRKTNVRGQPLVIDVLSPGLLHGHLIQRGRMTVQDFGSDFFPFHFAVQFLMNLRRLIGVVRHGFEMAHAGEEQPHQLLVFSDDRDVHRSEIAMFQAPPVVPIIDIGFAAMPVGIGDLFGGKFKRPRAFARL